MDKKIIAVLVAVVLVATSGGIYFLHSNSSDSEGTIDLTGTLTVLGNANMDSTIDQDDIDYVQGVIDGTETINTYCDANNDGVIDEKDISYIELIMDKTVTELYYVNANGDIASVTVPVENIVVDFRRTAETIVVLGASDMVVAIDNKTASDYSFLGLNDTSELIGSQASVDMETIINLEEEYEDSGGITIFCDATGSDQSLEAELGDSADVVRLPVTEYGMSLAGVVTTAFILSFNEEYGSQVDERLSEYLDWVSGILSVIEDAVDELGDNVLTTCLNALYTGTEESFAGVANGRGPTVSEYEYTVDCGADNLASGQPSSYELDEELLLELNPDYLVLMCQKSYVKSDDAESNCLEIAKSTYSGYTGKIVMIAQEVCTGPAYIISMMFYASLFLDGLSDEWDIQAEYAYYMETFIGNSDLADKAVFAV